MRRLLVAVKMIALCIAILGLVGCQCCKQSVDPNPVSPQETPRPKPAITKADEKDMPTVYFDYDKFEIRADQVARVDKSVEFLKANPSKQIRIDGNCDERGTSEYNMSLGQKRAETVANYMTGHGIAKDRVTILSKGKENPADPGHTEEAWAKNRRDEYWYTHE